MNPVIAQAITCHTGAITVRIHFEKKSLGQQGPAGLNDSESKQKVMAEELFCILLCTWIYSKEYLD